MENRIEKRIELKASPSRVWRALTDYREFGEWFMVKLEGPFITGKITRGQIAYPGCEHMVWQAKIEKMEPERLFSFTWPQIKSIDKKDYNPDYTGQPTTLVEFRLEPIPGGTLLTLTEFGFESVPADWRAEAFRRNEGGWSEQMKNIEKYVAQKP